MILKALNVYYIMALSKRDLKPFLKIGKCPQTSFLVLQVVVFVFNLPPEATESMKLMLILSLKNWKMYPKKAIPYIGSKIIFKASMSRKPINHWETENVKTWFWKLSTPAILWHCQNVISSHSRKPKNVQKCSLVL